MESNRNNFQSTDINQQLFTACTAKELNIETIQTLLQRGADPNYSAHYLLFSFSSSDHQYPLLHVIAGKAHSVTAAAYLLSYGASLGKLDTGIGNTALLSAIAMNDRELAKFLMESVLTAEDPLTITLFSQADYGIECQNTPLILALKKNLDDIALILIEMGADINMTDRNGNTALHWACMLRKNEIIQALLNQHIKKDVQNRLGQFAYDYYVYSLKLIDVAEQCGPFPVRKSMVANMLEFSDLYHHVEKGNPLLLQERIKERNAIPISNQLACAIAIHPSTSPSLLSRHQAIVTEQISKIKKCIRQLSPNQLLFDKLGKDDLTALTNIFDEETHIINSIRFANAPLSLAVKIADENIKNLLADKNTHINAASTDGFTALHWAAIARNNKLIKKLIEKGADPDKKNSHGRTAKDYYYREIYASDFKQDSDEKSYKKILQYLPESTDCFPEIAEYYHIDNIFACKFRNDRKIDHTIFEVKTLTQIILQSANSPVFKNADDVNNYPNENTPNLFNTPNKST